MEKYSHRGHSVVSRLSAELLIEPNRLTVFELPSDGQIQIHSSAGTKVWLTHSAIPQDFLLQPDERICLPAGVVLISLLGDPAKHAQISVISMARRSLMTRVGLWLNNQYRALSFKNTTQPSGC